MTDDQDLGPAQVLSFNQSAFKFFRRVCRHQQIRIADRKPRRKTALVFIALTRELVELNADNAKGTPVFIEP